MNTPSRVHIRSCRPSRREALRAAVATSLLHVGSLRGKAVESVDSRPRYLLASCLYGYAALQEILPEVQKTGATAIDIWPKVHGNQREQMDVIGERRITDLLARHQTQLGCITQYALGPFGLQDEMRWATRLGCQTIVTGARGPAKLRDRELKAAVQDFVKQMSPHLAVAEETGVTIAIENHGNNLIESPDSIKWLAELRPSAHLAIALAPYHLPQDPALIGNLIRELGERLQVFYAWQHGMGCMREMPKEQELLQLPGRGTLDFVPMMSALREIRFSGWIEIFMHPFPRGVPMLGTIAEITAEINRARDYLRRCERSRE